ncbi:MAG: hypothetical protein ABR501_02880 [Pyrinomonadaceae bacterium]
MNKLGAYIFSFVLILFTVHSGLAQRADLSGTWAGAMATDAGPGGLEITLAHAPPQWTGTMKFRLEEQETAPAVDDLKIDGDNISFSATLGPNLLRFAGKFTGDNLNGTVEAFRSDQKIGGGTFTLTRGGQMPALQQPQGGGQMADPNFKATVEKPAYKKSGPKILFDEAHNNFHTTSGRYKPFADLMTNDGYQIVPNMEAFSPQRLKGFRVLVISNALGASQMNAPNAGNPAFTETESDVVRDWVWAGGALLLIADHAPMGSANQILAQRFGVDMSKISCIGCQGC